jgi:aldehyde dehydrogenase (NAD+)
LLDPATSALLQEFIPKELGGQNPAFVDAIANLPDAARKIVWGTLAWGGQWCTSPGYAYLHDPLSGNSLRSARRQ